MDLSLQGLSMGNSSPPNIPGAAAARFNPPPPYGPPQPQQQAFGVVVPGRPVRTDFAPVDASGLKFALNLTCPGDLLHPLATIREIIFFLLPGITLPVDHGVLVYIQLAPGTAAPAMNQVEPPIAAFGGFELVGGITSDQPSAALPTGWSEKDDLVDLCSRGVPIIVTIAASIEPLVNLQNLGVISLDATAANNMNSNSNEKRLHVAQQIAYDLFYFMQSFDTGAAGPGNMVVPQNIFDRWFKRFENRFRRDPNFFMKKRDDA